VPVAPPISSRSHLLLLQSKVSPQFDPLPVTRISHSIAIQIRLPVATDLIIIGHMNRNNRQRQFLAIGGPESAVPQNQNQQNQQNQQRCELTAEQRRLLSIGNAAPGPQQRQSHQNQNQYQQPSGQQRQSHQYQQPAGQQRGRQPLAVTDTNRTHPERQLLAICETGAQGVDWLRKDIAKKEKELARLTAELTLVNEKRAGLVKLDQQLQMREQMGLLHAQELSLRQKRVYMHLQGQNQRIADLRAKLLKEQIRRAEKRAARQKDYDLMKQTAAQLADAEKMAQTKFDEVIPALNREMAQMRRNAGSENS
jgi:hypothetical protein